MTGDKSIVISGHGCSVENKNAIMIDSKFHIVKKSEILLSNIFRTTSTIMVRANSAKRFPKEKHYAEDYTFILNTILTGNKAIQIESTLACQYKEAYGISGLSENLWLMEKGELDAYYNLYQKNLISFITFILITIYCAINTYVTFSEGCEHHLLTSSPKNENDNSELLDKFSSYALNLSNNKIKALLQINKLYNSIQPTYVHLHSSLAGLYGRISGIASEKIIYTPHGYAFQRKDVNIFIQKYSYST